MRLIKKLLCTMFISLTLVLICPVSVQNNVSTVEAAVRINKKSVTLIKGQKLTLKISGTKKKVKWTTSKKSVATVSSKGKVTAKKKGNAVITAKIGKKKYKCKVKVETPSINKKTTTLQVGKSVTLKMKGSTQKVIWKSSDKNVATVNSSGKVTAKKPGTVKITATVLKKKYTCAITVYENFNSNEATKNIAISSAKIDKGVIVFLTNNNSYNVSVEMTCMYYDAAGALIGKNEDECYGIEAGKSVALFALNPYDSNFNDVEFSTYSISLNVEKPSPSIFNTDGIVCNANFGADNVMAEVKNNGKNGVEFTQIAVVFYKNGVPVGHEWHYAEVMNYGDSDVLEFDFPYDSNYNTIYPDDFKVYINGSYGYGW